MKPVVKYSIAAAFVVLAVGGNAYYTSYLQPKMMNPWVWEASTNIPENQVIVSADLQHVQVTRDAVVSGGITDPQSIIGKMAAFPIAQNGQFTIDNLETAPLAITPGTLSGPFVQNEFYAVDGSLRRGDFAYIYAVPSSDTNPTVGTTTASKVKTIVQTQQLQPLFSEPVPIEHVYTSSNREVTDSQSPGTSDNGSYADRSTASGTAAEIDVKVTTNQWESIEADIMAGDKFIFAYTRGNKTSQQASQNTTQNQSVGQQINNNATN